MSVRVRFNWILLFSVTCLVFITRPTRAFDYIWDSSISFDQYWFNPLNWSPLDFGPPTTSDTATINDGDFAQVNHDFAVNDQINALTLSGGSDLYTNGYEAIVDNGGTGTTLITGAGSTLRVDPHVTNAALDSFDTDLLTVTNGGRVSMQGGVLEVDSGKLSIGAGSELFGAGSVDLEAVLGSVTTVLENDGVIGVFPPPPFNFTVLDIDVYSVNGRIDLDGPSGNGSVQIGVNGTLDIGGPLSDAFSDVIGFFGGNTRLAMSSVWNADANSTINVDAGTGGLTDIATISGGVHHDGRRQRQQRNAPRRTQLHRHERDGQRRRSGLRRYATTRRHSHARQPATHRHRRRYVESDHQRQHHDQPGDARLGRRWTQHHHRWLRRARSRSTSARSTWATTFLMARSTTAVILTSTSRTRPTVLPWLAP
ncbi:MAG: hypothetical protein R3C10_23965 [Pirellulales bacterium]